MDETTTTENSNREERIRRMMLFLSGTNLEQMKKDFGNDEKFKPVIKKLEEMFKDPEFLEEYQAVEERNLVLKQIRHDGFSDGIEVGYLKGKIDMVQNMIKLKMPTIDIMKISEFSIGMIIEIRKIMENPDDYVKDDDFDKDF